MINSPAQSEKSQGLQACNHRSYSLDISTTDTTTILNLAPKVNASQNLARASCISAQKVVLYSVEWPRIQWETSQEVVWDKIFCIKLPRYWWNRNFETSLRAKPLGTSPRFMWILNQETFNLCTESQWWTTRRWWDSKPRCEPKVMQNLGALQWRTQWVPRCSTVQNQWESGAKECIEGKTNTLLTQGFCTRQEISFQGQDPCTRQASEPQNPSGWKQHTLATWCLKIPPVPPPFTSIVQGFLQQEDAKRWRLCCKVMWFSSLSLRWRDQGLVVQVVKRQEILLQHEWCDSWPCP